MPPVRNPAPQPIASLTSVMMLLLKGRRRRSALTAPLIPQARRPVPRPIAITAKFLASRLPTTGLISPQINSPTSRSPEKTAYRGPPFPYVVKNQPSTATPTAVALVAKSFVYFPSTDKLLTPQISSPTASPSNTKGKNGSMTSPPFGHRVRSHHGMNRSHPTEQSFG